MKRPRCLGRWKNSRQWCTIFFLASYDLRYNHLGQAHTLLLGVGRWYQFINVIEMWCEKKINFQSRRGKSTAGNPCTYTFLNNKCIRLQKKSFKNNRVMFSINLNQEVSVVWMPGLQPTQFSRVLTSKRPPFHDHIFMFRSLSISTKPYSNWIE
jgi:hypothetical protein